MDVVIPVGRERESLRYTLRSLVNIPHERVWILGVKPGWFTGEFLSSPRLKDRYQTTREAMRLACSFDRISDPFIWFNDDFYVMEPGPVPELMHRGYLDDVIGSSRSKWADQMRQAREVLGGGFCYEVHVPLVVHKDEMRSALRLPGAMRSLYGNLLQVPETFIEDVKMIHAGPVPAGRWLSNSALTWPNVKPVLEAKFPKPCVYEKVERQKPGPKSLTRQHSPVSRFTPG